MTSWAIQCYRKCQVRGLIFGTHYGWTQKLIGRLGLRLGKQAVWVCVHTPNCTHVHLHHAHIVFLWGLRTDDIRIRIQGLRKGLGTWTWFLTKTFLVELQTMNWAGKMGQASKAMAHNQRMSRVQFTEHEQWLIRTHTRKGAKKKKIRDLQCQHFPQILLRCDRNGGGVNQRCM